MVFVVRADHTTNYDQRCNAEQLRGDHISNSVGEIRLVVMDCMAMLAKDEERSDVHLRRGRRAHVGRDTPLDRTVRTEPSGVDPQEITDGEYSDNEKHELQ